MDLTVERVDDVAVIAISRPARRNALTLSMLGDLADRAEAAVDDGVAALILTGDATSFSSGVDLGELGQGASDARADDVIRDAARRVRRLGVPTVAAIEGPCVGGAVELVLACDARIVADGGFFAVPATRLGILYRPEGIAGLVDLVGRDTVSRLFLFNERFDAPSALSAGLATHLTERGGALARALELCAGVSRETREAVAATKELIGEVAEGTWELGHWSARREALLASDARRAALERATKSRREE